MKTIRLLALLLFLPFVQVRAQMIINNGNLDSVYTALDGSTQPYDWFVMGNNGGESTTDSYSGSHAVRIYNFNGNVAGELHYGYDNPAQTPGMPILINPVAIKGFYKFILGNNNDDNDTARAIVSLTRFDQLNGDTDTVGSGALFFSPTDVYTPFTIPVTYGADSLAADTLAMRFISSISCNCTDSSGTCCFLYIDELSLELPNGVTALIADQPVELMYDGAANSLSLSTAVREPWSIRLVDVTGRDVFFRERITGSNVQLDHLLPSGIYVYRAFVNGRVIGGKLSVR